MRLVIDSEYEDINVRDGLQSLKRNQRFSTDSAACLILPLISVSTN
jgi:hypothetical protein